MKKERIIEYSICFLFTISIGVIYFFSKEVADKETYKELVGCLSDVFLISGGLLLLSAALTLIWSRGGFDGIGYGFKAFMILFMPSKDVLKKKQTFYDYKKEKESKGRKWKKRFLYFGLADTILAIITFTIYYFM